MRKILEHCDAVLGRVILIGFGIQILLGVLWMYDAFAGMDSFGEGIVCVGQILLLGGAVWFVLPKGTPWIRIVCVLSFPIVLQCLMQPDLRVLMAVSLLMGIGCIRKFRGKKQMWINAFVFLLLGILAGAVAEPQTDLLTRIGSRTAWTTLYKEYERLPQDMIDDIDYDMIAESTYEATGVEDVFMPSLEMTLGRQRSREILKELIAVSWEYSKGRITKEILWDEAGYLFSPLILPLQLKGRAYESYSGLNYRQFLQVAPRLGSFYMRYGCLWFAVVLAIRGLHFLTAERRVDKPVCIYTALTVGGMSLWYSLSSAGRMDYRNTVYILCVWLIWLTDLLRRERPYAQKR